MRWSATTIATVAHMCIGSTRATRQPGGSPFSKQRLRLLQEVRRRSPNSLDELPHRLHREKTRVSKDVQLLQGLGLLKTSKKGRTKRLESAAPLVLIE